MTSHNTQLRRELGTPSAVMLGLGSIVGTGVFVSLGLAAGVAGPWVLAAIVIAAAVAVCNGLSSAQLAAAHPVSGGTYEYGYRLLDDRMGFAAGWMFLCAKTASAATAALGLGGYLARAFAASANAAPAPIELIIALAAVGLLTVLTLTGMRRTSAVNSAIVSVTLASLGYFCIAGMLTSGSASHDMQIAPRGDVDGLLHAAALIFVAFTGYGRVATLGEEVREPRRTIPRAIIAVLVVAMLLYVAVTWVALRHRTPAAFAALAAGNDAPLAIIAGDWALPGSAWVLAIGAATAMLGVLLNLILGLSRVALAMARRGDLPRVFARVEERRQQPMPAILLTATCIAGVALVRDVRLTWSFSALTVLIYYAITNLCALRLPAEQRLYPRWIAWLGLLACMGLAFRVELRAALAGLVVLAVGVVWHEVARRTRGAQGHGD